MPNHDRELTHRSAQTFFQPDKQSEFSDDTILAIAYWISEYAITFIGPYFWMWLILLFLVAEFRG
jgi:hypothetical protein